MSLPRPRPEDYRTRAEYRWAKRQWRKHYGGWGSAGGSVLMFFFVVMLTRSAVFGLFALALMLAWPIAKGMREP